MKINTEFTKYYHSPRTRVTSIDMVVAKKIKYYRLIKGFSQKSLGDAIGVSVQQIQKYEKGKNRVSVGRFYKIAEFLDVDIVSLLDAKFTPINFNSATKEKKILRLINLCNLIQDDKLVDNLYLFLERAFNCKNLV